MSFEEVKQKMTCRHCGAPLVVLRAKRVSGTQVKLIMECPIHQDEIGYKTLTSIFEQAPALLRDHVLRCRTCGKPVQEAGSRVDGADRVMIVRCPDHGEGKRVVNGALYSGMATPSAMPAVAPEPKPVAAGATGFCPSCGTKVAIPGAQFCHNCGASLA